MQTPDENNQCEADLEALPRLASALKQVSERRIFVPPTIDDAILSRASCHLNKPAAAWTIRIKWLRWASAAAMLLLLGFFALVVRHPNPSEQPRFAKEDLNHDGRVDILDAFILARQVAEGRSGTGIGVDVNGDGVVDERDVTALAAHAVQLQKGGRS